MTDLPQAGPELDLMAYEEVMGKSAASLADRIGAVDFRPSTDIADAFRLVEAMGKRGVDFQLLHWAKAGRWGAQFEGCPPTTRNNAPEVITVAAILAIRTSKEPA